MFVKEDFRKETFKSIAKEILSCYKDHAVLEFMNYYYVNWFLGHYFRNDDLYERMIYDIPFTNNGAEGFNSALKKEVKMAHPSIIELLIVLRNRDFLSELSKYNNYTRTTKQNLKYLERSKKLLNIIRDMDENNFLLKLKEITAVYNFKDDILN